MSPYLPPRDLEHPAKRVAPQGRVPPRPGLMSLVRRHMLCLRRRAPLTSDDSALLELMEEIERCYVRLLCSGAPWHDAEDVVHTALERLYERQDKVPPAKRPAWLKSAVWAVNMERHRQWATEQGLARKVERELKERAERTQRQADVQLGEAQLSADTRRLLGQLRPEEQAVVEHYVFQDMTMEQTAVALGIKEATARKRWRRAADQLFERVQREDAQESFSSGGFKRYALTAALLLRMVIRRWLRGIAPEREAESGTKAAAHGPIIAAAIPIAAISIFVLTRVQRPVEVSSVESVPLSSETSAPSVGLFLSTWAERERDTVPGDAMADPQDALDASKGEAAREARDLLATAQDAVGRNALVVAARALKRYELTRPDDPYPTIHAELRIALALKSVPR